MFARRLLPLLAAAVLVPAASAAAAPYNDNFENAPKLTGSQVSLAFSLTGATTQFPLEPDHFTYEYGHTVWFTWTPAESGGVHVKACDNDDAKIKVYTGSSISGLTEVAPGPGHTNHCDAWRDFVAVAGTPYRIVVDHAVGSTDYAGVLKIDQRVQKPVATFPSWPKKTGKTFQGHVLRTTTYIDGFDSMYGAFKCELDGSPVYCDEDGPYLKDLEHGPHTFKATAMDPYGNWQEGWSTWTWDVDAVAPVTTVTSWATPLYTEKAPLVTWQASEPNVSFKCVVDANGDAVPCSSPWQAPELAPGSHTVTIYATDPYGNHGSPKGAKWVITAPPVQTATTETPQPPAPTTTTVTTTTTTTGATPPPAPCAPKATALTTSQRTIRTRGMRVRIVNPAARSCTVELVLRAGTRTLARQVRPVAARGTLVVTLKPRVRAPRGARIRLVSRAR
jgi:hypothetical protein